MIQSILFLDMFLKRIKERKQVTGRKHKEKEKSPMRKKENQYTSLDVFLYTVLTAGLPELSGE
jgi:hypothetical protein